MLGVGAVYICHVAKCRDIPGVGAVYMSCLSSLLSAETYLVLELYIWYVCHRC